MCRNSVGSLVTCKYSFTLICNCMPADIAEKCVTIEYPYFPPLHFVFLILCLMVDCVCVLKNTLSAADVREMLLHRHCVPDHYCNPERFIIILLSNTAECFPWSDYNSMSERRLSASNKNDPNPSGDWMLLWLLWWHHSVMPSMSISCLSGIKLLLQLMKYGRKVKYVKLIF